MHVVVTGANGFIGKLLVKRLLKNGLQGVRIARLSLIDVAFDECDIDDRVEHVTGSLADKSVIQSALGTSTNTLFHLASVPGGAAEKNYSLGRQINLDATSHLLDQLALQKLPATFVFASTVAVYGETLPSIVTEATLPAPALSYGAHKLASEILIADATRKGWVNGCSLRLPGVVARPGNGIGLMSAFMSQLFWKLAANEPITMPVSAGGTAWWISARVCVDNLLAAASIPNASLNAQKSYQMPALHLSMQEVVSALAELFGPERSYLVSWKPEPLIERLFARYPPLQTPQAEKLGFRHDGDTMALVKNALQLEDEGVIL